MWSRTQSALAVMNRLSGWMSKLLSDLVKITADSDCGQSTDATRWRSPLLAFVSYEARAIIA
jgi:hypothetical protein